MDSRVLKQLGFKPIDFTKVHTPSTGKVPSVHGVYDVSIIFVGLCAGQGRSNLSHQITAVPVIEADFQHQEPTVLIGRDLLGGTVFIYHGHDKSFTLVF